MLKRNYISIGPVGVIKDSGGHRLIYIPLEGLYTPKPIPNLDIKSSRPIYPTIVVGRIYAIINI